MNLPSLTLATLLCGISFCPSPGMAQTPTPNIVVSIIKFDLVSSLPNPIADYYKQLYEDTKTLSIDLPQFSISYFNVGKKELFVRVNSPLTCSANGQCETDLYTLDPTPARLFSATVENIGFVKQEMDLTNVDSQPTLVTNVPIDSSLVQFAQQTLVVDPAKIGGQWKWIGKGYQ